MSASASSSVVFDAGLDDIGCGGVVRKLFGRMGQSQIYAAGYPQASIVHTYHHDLFEVPFAGRITNVTLPPLFENLLSTTFKGYTPVFSFVVQEMPDKDELKDQHL